jgi:hypothetical protein
MNSRDPSGNVSYTLCQILLVIPLAHRHAVRAETLGCFTAVHAHTQWWTRSRRRQSCVLCFTMTTMPVRSYRRASRRSLNVRPDSRPRRGVYPVPAAHHARRRTCQRVARACGTSIAIYHSEEDRSPVNPQWTSILRRCRTGKVRSAPGRIARRRNRTLTIAPPAAHKEALLPALIPIPGGRSNRAVCDRTVSGKLMVFVYVGAAEHCCGRGR